MRGGKKDTSFFSSVKFVKKCKKNVTLDLGKGVRGRGFELLLRTDFVIKDTFFFSFDAFPEYSDQAAVRTPGADKVCLV